MTTTLPGSDDLIRFLDRWRRRRIVVAGDFMLDHYIYGNADRLSPDAPVPVLAVVREEHKPGGSANVCLDLRALHSDVACLGVIGADSAGTQLRSALRKAGCDVKGLLIDRARPTTVKQNLVGLAQHRHPQKMFRVDVETRDPLSADSADRLVATAKKLLRGADALCLEDYNKGVLSEAVCRRLIELAKKMRVPVYVDPAAITDYRKYRGATCITPNRTEAALATGANGQPQSPATLARMAQRLLRELSLDAVVLTLDKQGAMLLEKGGRPIMVPTVARQVYDVTGAGDMVLAMLAASRANGADWPASVDLANTAAGLEVEKFGVVPIELDEVLLALLERRHESLGKLRTAEQITTELAAHRRRGRKIVFTNGCFDILHAGHVQFLREARRGGDLLVVGLNSDRSIRRLKGEGRPVNHEADRVMVLSELESVDYIVVFGEQTPIRLIKSVRPDVLVKGADYRKDQVVGGSWVERNGGSVMLVSLVKGRSTTNIIRRIAKQSRR
ncbi:MAG: D-glycero-beta-D-manno-heptose 1-phosphate adenylyltransferase [Planctomycetes bacterium]|nr:D-glycero-beta-D-manno-heptose 1-phosphate adenylyltransferase [Planctomycetota bacterium]